METLQEYLDELKEGKRPLFPNYPSDNEPATLIYNLAHGVGKRLLEEVEDLPCGTVNLTVVNDFRDLVAEAQVMYDYPTEEQENSLFPDR